MFKTLSKINTPDGRFEIIKGNKNVIGIVDYAHTPDALLNVLKTIKKIKKNRKVITVVGAGGERDKTKRPIMGKIASELSDFVIITSDNPRFENEMDINIKEETNDYCIIFMNDIKDKLYLAKFTGIETQKML